MLRIEIQKGAAKDAVAIAQLIKKMVLEMEQYGGHAINESPAVWSSVENQVRANTTRKDYLYLLAYCGSPAQKIVGVAAANIEPLENIFVAKKRLHLSAVYTIHDARRQGVAWQLIQVVLAWGKQMNAEEADLNVLVTNPALHLYEKLGYELHEVSLLMKLAKKSMPNST